MDAAGSSAGAYEIGRARPEDLADVQAVLKATWHATYDAVLGAERVEEVTESWHALHVLEAEGRRENHVRLVARLADRIVATSGATLIAGELLELHQLYILPEHQRCGLGRRLLRETIACFPSARRIGLEVEAHNTHAIRSYEAWGFRRLGEVSDCGQSGSGIRALVYEMDLA